MMNDDRISEVYKGEIWGDDAQERARRRINWMVTQAVGDRVLDVGCSQGIASILLGREGFHVTGIDIQESRVGYAKEDLASESEQTQARVEFIHGDVLDAGFQEDAFDTVLLGEVLEHLVSPERMLSEIAKITKPDGRVVITTPFGHLHHHDHKQTFFPRNLMTLLARDLKVVSVGIEDRYFRIVATPEGVAPDGSEMEATLLDLAGKTVAEIQQDLVEARTQVLRTRRELAEATEVTKRIEETLGAAQRENAESSLEIERLKAEVAEITWKETELRASNREASREVARLRRQSIKLEQASTRQRERANDLELKVWRLDNDLALAKWKLQSMRARKWWRLGGALGRARRAPWKLAEVFSIVRGKSTLPPKPLAKPRPPGRAASKKGRAETYLAVTTAPPIPKRLIPAAVLADTEMLELVRHEFQASPVEIDNWRKILDLERPRLLLVAGRGVELLQNAPVDVQLQLLESFRGEGVATVMWDTGHDSPDERNLALAAEFDLVLVASESVEPTYRAAIGEDRVVFASLAIAPEVHNPIKAGERVNPIAVLAESFRGEPRPDFETIVDLGRDVGLAVLSSDAIDADLPAEVVGKARIVDEPIAALKSYRAAIGGGEETGDVVSSDILRIAASNTPMVIPENRAAGALFGSSVLQPTSEREAARTYRALLRSDAVRARQSHPAMRHVMRHHKIGDRVDTMLDRVGLGEGQRDVEPISIVVPTNRPGQLEHLMGSVGKQTYPSLELVLVLHGIEIDDRKIKDTADAAGVGTVNVVRVPSDVVLGDVINLGFDEASHRLAAKMDDDDHYGAEYMSDLADALDFSGADIVGKWAHFAYVEGANSMILRYGEHEHVYREVLAISTLLLDKAIFETVRFPSMPVGSGSVFLKAAAAEGARAYSADRFNYVYMRYADPSHHTFPISNLHLTSAEFVCHGLNLDHAMV